MNDVVPIQRPDCVVKIAFSRNGMAVSLIVGDIAGAACAPANPDQDLAAD
jgi:hypothetical protein